MDLNFGSCRAKIFYMTANELRQKYLEFFREKGHAIIPSASLVPENDPTVLFTTAGMQPLVPYLLGEKHPQGQRLVNVQKCVRTNDIDEVGDATHYTFFEMLGNWSIGDSKSPDGLGENGYWKKEAINWSFEFLTSEKYLGISLKRLAVSVFAGDEDAPFDKESFELWKSLGIPESRIAKLPKKNNWWGQVLGPCGPNTEMFVWTGPSTSSGQAPAAFDPDDANWVEVWNNVFMEFNRKIKERDENGNPIDFYFEPLAQKNVDTGMGLERMITIKQEKKSAYETELFNELMNKIDNLLNLGHQTSGKIAIGRMEQTKNLLKSKRIIADHIRAIVFIISDGVIPSNTGRGYVLRRLIRRAMRYMGDLIIEKGNLVNLADVIIEQYGDIYENIKNNAEQIRKEIKKEEEKFEKTLESGLKEFKKGTDAFTLFSTYGFPIELTKELAKESGIEIDEKDFEEKLKQHQELSRTASAGMFKGGLADASEETIKYHTAAHLMLAALRRVLGEQVSQKGSNITAERLRFDFSWPQKMTAEQIKQVEDLVNEKIQADLPVSCEEMNLEEAKTQGATGVFESKYGERVKVYTIGPSTSSGFVPFSREICGGPHVPRTGVLGKFKIVKEEASSAGVRRIKAILE